MDEFKQDLRLLTLEFQDLVENVLIELLIIMIWVASFFTIAFLITICIWGVFFHESM